MNEEDSTLVRKIPLSRANTEDKLIWQDSISDTFSVKSAYYVACAVLGGDGQDRDSKDRLWKDIWTANVIPKIKVFMWKIVHSIIPTRYQLQVKGIQGIHHTGCVVCGIQVETIKHVFFYCYLSKEIWFFIQICKCFVMDFNKTKVAGETY